MNAQEAIENMNRTLNRRISEKERLEPHKDDYPYMYKNASEHVKALSIVLELAKKEDKAETRLYDIAGHMMDYYQAGTLSEKHLIELIDKELTVFYTKGANK